MRIICVQYEENVMIYSEHLYYEDNRCAILFIKMLRQSLKKILTIAQIFLTDATNDL